MVYAALTDEKQVLSVPRAEGLELIPGPFRLTLRKGGKDVVLDGLEDAGTNELYYVFEVENAAQVLVTGEYDYELSDIEGHLAGIGILTAGDYVREVKDMPGEMHIVEYGG